MLENEIIEVIASCIGESVTLNMHSNIKNTENWDSLAQMRIILTLEQKYAIIFTDEEAGDFTSVESFISAVENRK